MTKGTRRLMFYFAVAVFIGASYVAILYAQGYKYSAQEHRFIRTGAISLNANADAKVFVDDELSGTTSFLANRFSVDGLLPGQYSIRLQRDNYSSWQKMPTVQEGFVTDFPRVLILPLDDENLAKLASEAAEIFASLKVSQRETLGEQLAEPTVLAKLKTSPTATPSPTPVEPFVLKNKVLTWQPDGLTGGEQSAQLQELGKNVAGFMISESNKKMAWWTFNNELYVMWLADTDYQPVKKKGDRELVTRFATSINDIAWFRGDDQVILLFKTGYRIVEIDTRGGVNIIKI